MGLFIDHKTGFFVAFENLSGRRRWLIFLLISFLFSLMKSKQVVVRGPTGVVDCQ